MKLLILGQITSQKAEIRAAITKLKNENSGGKDKITAELLKVDMRNCGLAC